MSGNANDAIAYLEQIERIMEDQRRQYAERCEQFRAFGWDLNILQSIMYQRRRGLIAPDVDLESLYQARVQERDLNRNSNDAPKSGFIYFIRFDRTKRLKIGYTTKLGSRLRTIENAGGERGQLCALLVGSLSLENDAHRSFRKWRLKGEWFDYTPECAAHIERFRTEYGPSSETLQGKLIASVVGTA